MPRYCLFGDTVYTANKMEATSAVNWNEWIFFSLLNIPYYLFMKPMRIHITQTTKQFLQGAKFETIERGILEVSDKIVLKTFVVVGLYNKAGNLEIFPYKEDKTEDEKFKNNGKFNPKWEGFKLIWNLFETSVIEESGKYYLFKL